MLLNKKSQITIFAIIGLVILFSVSMVLFLQNSMVDKQLQAQAENSISSFLELNSINFYVTSCLNKVSSEGLSLLSDQGGFIYDYQGGFYPTDNFEEGVNYLPHNFSYMTINENNESIKNYYERNVSYVIRDFVNCPGSYIRPIKANFSQEETSYYPAKNLKFIDYVNRYGYSYNSFLPGCNGLSSRVSLMSGYLGGNYLPKLCSYNGSNAANTSDYSCASHQYDSAAEPYSIQRQLEYYIKQNLKNCINFDYYTQNLTAYNITVNQSNVKINTIFQNPSGILVKAKYPFTVSLDGKKEILKQVDFQTSLDVNIKNLYTFIYNILRYMLRVPTFNLLKDYSFMRGYVSSMTLNVEKNACENCSNINAVNDDIITFTDYSSKLKGNPFSLTFAIKQRKPILNYIHDDSQSIIFNNKSLDFMFFTNSSITIEPEAIDPDGDNFTFGYLGWKESFDQEFNYTCCKEKNCVLANHTLCLINKTNQPHEWTKSVLFNTTNESAKITTNESDIGYHEVTVYVTDEHGAKDFQIVKYLIFDLPIAKLTGKNTYLDINNNLSSVEDPYYLDASKSTASMLGGGDLSNFVFKDYDEDFHINSTNSTISLPFDNFDFFNITNQIFSFDKLIPLENKMHDVFLIVAQDTGKGIIYSQPSHFNINVAQCLTHGINHTTKKYPPANIQTSNGLSQEYHWDYSENYFDAPHVCCEPLNTQSDDLKGAGIYYNNTQTCLNIPVFRTCYPLNGDYIYLKRSLIDINKSLTLPLNKTNYALMKTKTANDYFIHFFPIGYNDNLNLVSFQSKDFFNDIFTVNFNQKCSGFRGNSCGGDLDVTWTVKKSCNDLNDVSGQFARCQGPSISFNSCVGKNVAKDLPHTNLECENFSTGHSFEKDWLYEKNLLSNENFVSADILDGFCAPEQNVDVIVDANKNYLSTQKNVASGKYSCKASCDLTDGTCGYNQLNGDCSCNGNTCSDYGASDLFEGIDSTNNVFGTPTKAKFVCKTNKDACSYDCLIKPKTTTKEGCYCQINNKGTTYENLNNFLNFMDSTTYESFSIQEGLCCVNQNIIVKKANSPIQNKVCFKGVLKGNNTIFDSSNPRSQGDKKLLSCDGNLIYCCGLNSCTAPNHLMKIATSTNSNNACGKSCNQYSGQWQ